MQYRFRNAKLENHCFTNNNIPNCYFLREHLRAIMSIILSLLGLTSSVMGLSIVSVRRKDTPAPQILSTANTKYGADGQTKINPKSSIT